MGKKTVHQPMGRKMILGKTKDEMKDALGKGLVTLLNRSPMKGIVDPTERSVAIGEDVMKKMLTMSQAMGMDPVSALKMLGSKV